MPGTTAAQIATVFLIYFSDKINSIIVLAGDTCELGLWFRPCFAISSFDENSSTIHRASHVGISQNMAYATTPATGRGVTSGAEFSAKSNWYVGFSAVSSTRTLISKGANSLWASKLSTLPVSCWCLRLQTYISQLDNSSVTNLSVGTGKNRQVLSPLATKPSLVLSGHTVCQ